MIRSTQGRAAAILAVSVVASAASSQGAAAQTRTFVCPQNRAVTLTVTGPKSISAAPIEGGTTNFEQSPTNPLQFNFGDYRLTISPDQSRATIEIPDDGTYVCTFQPQVATGGMPGLGRPPEGGGRAPQVARENAKDPCGPGFRQAPETDRCDPLPGTNPNARPNRRTGTAEGDFPMVGRSLGGVVRSAPSLSAGRLGSLAEGAEVTILARDVDFDGYSWFKIDFRGRHGFQWGGIMCSNAPIRGIFQQCEP